MVAAMVAVTLAFGTNGLMDKNAKNTSLDQAWFEYVGSVYTSQELAKQTNYEKLDEAPSCQDGTQRCAILANIENVGGVEYPADDANHVVIFSSEKKFNP